MSKSKKILGAFIACTVVVVILYSISELRKYQSSKNERTQLIEKIVDQFYEQCVEEKGKSLLNKKG